MKDVVALGELLIDFAHTASDDAGYPTLAAQPGGAPGNFLAALQRYGCSTALLGKVGDDTFGHLLVNTLKQLGIETRGILTDPAVFTTLAFVTLDSTGADKVQVSVNKPVADGYFAALKQLSEDYGLSGEISVSLLSRFPEVLLAEKAEEDVEQMARDICSVLDRALVDFDQMRAREGQRLKADILSRAAAIEEKVAVVEKRSPQTVAEYRAKLEARMEEVLSNTQLDPARILTEAALFADKVAVDEETVRLRSHISQLRGMLDKGGATGRKLDFLIQEFNREANTIGSKCSDIEISGQVVDIKAEIEKIREQVQNIE